MIISEDMEDSMEDEDEAFFFWTMTMFLCLSEDRRLREDDLSCDIIRPEFRKIIKIMKRENIG
jgi:hypothetical protein